MERMSYAQLRLMEAQELAHTLPATELRNLAHVPADVAMPSHITNAYVAEDGSVSFFVYAENDNHAHTSAPQPPPFARRGNHRTMQTTLTPTYSLNAKQQRKMDETLRGLTQRGRNGNRYRLTSPPAPRPSMRRRPPHRYEALRHIATRIAEDVAFKPAKHLTPFMVHIPAAIMAHEIHNWENQLGNTIANMRARYEQPSETQEPVANTVPQRPAVVRAPAANDTTALKLAS